VGLRRDLYEVWTLRGQSPKRVARGVWNSIFADNVLGYAAQLAYYFLFSIFPFFIFLTALLAYIPVPGLIEEIMALVNQLMAEEAAQIIEHNVRDLVTRPRGGLLSFSILLALFFASNAVAAMADALNHAYGVTESRPLWKARGVAVLLTLVLAALLVASMLLLIFGPELGGFLAGQVGLGPQFAHFWDLIRWPIVVVLLMVGVAIVYYFAPDVEQEWRWITPGSVVAVLAWIAGSLAFRYYVERFGEYNATYGSLGAIIVLLTWMYLTGFFLLLGGEINAEIEHGAPTGKEPGAKELPRAGGHEQAEAEKG
jgi:membrane protein